jgi:lysophospholipase L1-like esterase
MVSARTDAGARMMRWNINATAALICLCLIGSLAWDAWARARTSGILDVAIGASVCNGSNANPFSASWQGMLLASVRATHPTNNVLNLCGANNTGNMLPTGASTPNCVNNSGSVAPDVAHNITAALSHHPRAVIMVGGQANFISGGRPGRGLCYPNTVADIEADIAMIANTASRAGVQFYFTSAGPETSWTATQKGYASAVNRWAAARYPTRYLNTSSVLDDGSGNLKAIYDSGDGIHPNNAGHAAMFTIIQGSGLFKIR